MRERQRQVRRPLDDKRYKGWSKELTRTGDLVFKITTWLPREITIIWKDDAEKPLEWQLEDIVAVLSLVGPRLVRQRKVRAADQERRLDEQHRQYLAKQRRDQDERRWQRLLELAHRRDQAESVRRLVADIESQPHPQGNFGGLTAVEWLEWARRWLEQFDPLMRKPQDLYEELAAVRAF